MKPASQRLFVTFALMIVALVVLAGVFEATSLNRQILASAPATAGKAVTTGTASIGGPFMLASSRGDNVTDRSFPGKWLLIFFGYTSCPDVCPTALTDMSTALGKGARMQANSSLFSSPWTPSATRARSWPIICSPSIHVSSG